MAKQVGNKRDFTSKPVMLTADQVVTYLFRSAGLTQKHVAKARGIGKRTIERHDAAMREALSSIPDAELMSNLFRAMAPEATETVWQIMRGKKSTATERLTAARMLLGYAGFEKLANNSITVNLTLEQQKQRLYDIADRFKIAID